MLDLSLNALMKIILYIILFIIVSVLIFSYKSIKNLHVVMIFILFLVLILKNSIKQN
jgi:hypothetical protein